MKRLLNTAIVGLLGATLIVAPWSWLRAQERAAFPISKPLPIPEKAQWQAADPGERPAKRVARATQPRSRSLRVDWGVLQEQDEPTLELKPRPSDKDEPWQMDEDNPDETSDEKSDAETSDDTAVKSEEWIDDGSELQILPASGFDLPALIGLAQQNHPALRKLRARIEQGEGLQFQATRYPNPTFGYFAQEVGNEGAAGQHGLFWNQTWVRGNKLDIAGEVTGWEIERRKWLLTVERHKISYLVREAYYNLLAARRTQQMTDRILEISRKNQATVEELFEAGEIAKNSVLQAKLETQRFELQSQSAAIKVQRFERLLAIATANPQMDLTTVTGDILGTAPKLVVEEVVSWLEQESPELEVARSEIERTIWRVQQEEARPIPNVNTQIGGMYDDATGDPSFNFQVSWQVPRHNRNCGNITAAEADARRAEAEYEELQLNLRTRVQRVFTQYDLARQQVDSFEQNMLPMAQENLKITQEAYKVGEATYQTLLTAQRSYFDSALSLIESRRLLWLAVTRIQGLVIPE